MGYLTQNLIGHSPVFQSKVELALTKLVDSTISNSQNAGHLAMAKVVMHDIPRFAKDLSILLAIEGKDLDSLDTAIDSGILNNLPWLLAKTDKGA